MIDYKEWGAIATVCATLVLMILIVTSCMATRDKTISEQYANCLKSEKATVDQCNESYQRLLNGLPASR